MSEWCKDSTGSMLLALWQSMKPPARPSEDTMRIYETNILKYGLDKKGDWAILGCTPEFRSLAGRFQRPLTCIDKDSRPFSALEPMCCPPEDEILVLSDWLETDLPEHFDLIFGDGSINMLSKERHQGFIDSLHRMLKPGGIAMMRLLCYQDDFSSPEEIIRWYRESCPNSLPLTSLRTIFAAQFLDLDTMVIEPKTYTTAMKELFQKKILTPEEYAEFQSFPMNVALNFIKKETFEAQLGNCFKILSVEYSKDLASGYCYPIYILQRR